MSAHWRFTIGVLLVAIGLGLLVPPTIGGIAGVAIPCIAAGVALIGGAVMDARGIR